MEFKTELHCHTAEVSPCGKMLAADVAEIYIKAGFKTVVVCDHFTDYVIDPAGKDWKMKIDHYLAGYRKMKAAAGDRLNVILGCELRFIENNNDYLIFGITEEFLYGHPELHRMTPKSFSALSRENGFIFVQAHPLRDGMKIITPSLLDGVEVFNGNPSHDGRNDLVDLWARRYGLTRTSGSDYHGGKSIDGGIITKDEIKTSEDLLRHLRAEDYTLICTGAAAERDHMQSMPAKYDRG